MSGFTSGQGRNMPKRRDTSSTSSARRLMELERSLGSRRNETPDIVSSLPTNSTQFSPFSSSNSSFGRPDIMGSLSTQGRNRGLNIMGSLSSLGQRGGSDIMGALSFGKQGAQRGLDLVSGFSNVIGAEYAMDQMRKKGIWDTTVDAAKGVVGGIADAVGGVMPSDWGDLTGGRNLEGVQEWAGLIDKVAKESGVPWQVLASVMGIESGGKNGGVSPAGATGLMQVMPEYWQDTANKYGGDLMDPYTNIRTAADVLLYYEGQFGGWVNAAGGYLAGSPFSDERDAFGTGVSDYQKWFTANMDILSGISSPVSSSGASIPSGERAFPVAGYTGGLSLHHGSHPGAVDIFADYGTPVLAITGGTATSGYSDIGGYWTMIQGDDGLQYYYAHMDKMGPNGRVDTGAYISGVSDTGNAKGTGAHLHLGIGNTIYSGTGPQGGAGDINVAEFLAGAYRT